MGKSRLRRKELNRRRHRRGKRLKERIKRAITEARLKKRQEGKETADAGEPVEVRPQSSQEVPVS